MAVLTFPANPSNNDLYTAENDVVYIYQTNKWTSIGAVTEGVNIQTLNVISMGPNPPSNPQNGNLWYNETNGYLYVWFVDEDQVSPAGQWVDTRPPQKSDES